VQVLARPVTSHLKPRSPDRSPHQLVTDAASMYSLAYGQASLGYQRIPLQASGQHLYCLEGVAF